MIIRSFLIVGIACLATGCAKGPLIRTSAPAIVQVPANANPDVIWVTRVVELAEKGNEKSSAKAYGLFACYRPANPGTPECYLAKVMGENRSLVWPENPAMFNFPADMENPGQTSSVKMTGEAEENGEVAPKKRARNSRLRPPGR
jgi:hypothetical protein